MRKHSQDWCEAVAAKLVDVMAEFDADATDLILAGAHVRANEMDESAADVLRGLADLTDDDNRRRAN